MDVSQTEITHKNQSLLKFIDTMKGEEKVTYHLNILVLSYKMIEYGQKFKSRTSFGT